jgi:DnaJ-class molecular chaperone
MLTINKGAKMTNKPITSDLFQVDTCFNCEGEGQVDKTPKNATYELYEDCDICKGTGILQ